MSMTQTPMPGPLPSVSCQCYGDENMCVCGDDERILRAGVPLTADQREWCLNEIASVEGHERQDYESHNDSELGRAVISAWRDYCRDKGLM